MTFPRVIFFDIGSTLWSSPAEAPEALAYCYGRGLQLLQQQSLPNVPDLDTLIETVEGYFAHWEDRWRDDHSLVQQRPTTDFVAEALATIDFSLSPRVLAEFTDVILETSIYTAKLLPLEPENREALRELRKRNLRLACVSNAFMSAMTLHRIMEERGYGSYLDLTVSSCDLGIRKPHPAIYEAALDRMNASAGESIFVGDRLDADIEGPAALGMRTVLSQQYRQEDLATAKVQPDYIIAHLSDLVDCVDDILNSDA